MAKKKVSGINFARWGGMGSNAMGAALGSSRKRRRKSARMPGIDLAKSGRSGSRAMSRAIGR